MRTTIAHPHFGQLGASPPTAAATFRDAGSQIDIGFGDRITPDPEEIEYPTLLDMPPARILAYPPETSIAEKFQVMLQRGVLNSRMKDFFDIWALCQARAFDGPILSQAIRTTCEHRATPVDGSCAGGRGAVVFPVPPQ